MDTRPKALGPLGKQSLWPTRLAPETLFAIERGEARKLAGLDNPTLLPPFGEDTWTAWEFAWRDERGWPRAGVLQLTIPQSSHNLIESKSLKLYLHGYAEQRFNIDALLAMLTQDLSAALKSPLGVELLALNDRRLWPQPCASHCIDAAAPNAALLNEDFDAEIGELLPSPTQKRQRVDCITHTFGSLCPVTSQPDWASVRIQWFGAGPAFDNLARYLATFRNHRGFHEACVEQIWRDLWHTYRLEALSVRAQFTRRGGIDIAPARSHDPHALIGWNRLSRL